MLWADVLKDGEPQCSKNHGTDEILPNPYNELNYSGRFPSVPGIERLKEPSDPQDAQNPITDPNLSASQTDPTIATPDARDANKINSALSDSSSDIKVSSLINGDTILDTSEVSD